MAVSNSIMLLLILSCTGFIITQTIADDHQTQEEDLQLWFNYLEFHLKDVLVVEHGYMSAVYLRLYDVYRGLHAWCHVSHSAEDQPATKNRVNIVLFAPCGKMEAFTPDNTLPIKWHIQVPPMFVIMIKFLLFEMEDSGYDCMDTALWFSGPHNTTALDSHRYCGTVQPDDKLLFTSNVTVNVFQRNVLNFLNLTFEYQVYSMMNSHRHLLDKTFTVPGLSPDVPHQLYLTSSDISGMFYYLHVSTNYGSSLHFRAVYTCCITAVVVIHDGPASAYPIARFTSDSDSSVSVTDEQLITILNKAYITVEIAHFNYDARNLDTMEPFQMTYSSVTREARRVHINESVHVTNGDRLLHAVYALSPHDVLQYPVVSFNKVRYVIII